MAPATQAANRAVRFLEEQGVAHETLLHREAFTAQGVAAAAHVSGWKVAKVVLVRDAAGQHFMAVLPASCRLDLQALELITGKARLSLASEAEMQRLFPDCETGAMPPFGNLYGMPVFVDACFPRERDFVFQPGNHHEVVRMPYADFARLAQPVVADVCCH